eukprot:TRINITY_DN7896_c0_g1_i4.p1 TRINITY_DN7896_c0_g1~~TRINITY_DN7896_c0_g1_i4.p1  ORF type:complete len:447 (+),score=14.69 TRINITY_DN7896_c0_g1_i4:744-2084(+)
MDKLQYGSLYRNKRALFSGFILHQKTICAKLIPYPHTIESIALSIKEELDRNGIYEKVHFMITDNASNMTGAAKALKFASIPCAVHTIQLMVKALLKAAKGLVGKARNLVNFFRDSPKRRQNLEAAQLILSNTVPPVGVLSDCKTRWNSTYLMIERLLYLENAIYALKTSLASSLDRKDKEDAATLANLLLKPKEVKALKGLQKILSPFKFACDKIGASKFPTLSLVYPFVYRLIQLMSKSEDTEFEVSKAEVSRLMHEKWEEGCMEAMMASFFDPRFKSLEFLEGELKNKVIAIVKSKCPQSATRSESAIQKQSSLLEFFGSPILYPQRTLEKSEIEKYIEEPGIDLDTMYNPLTWWKQKEKQYPELGKLAEIYLSIPATSVSVERLFSLAGDIITKKRSRLDPGMVNNLLILKTISEQFYMYFLDMHFNFKYHSGFRFQSAVNT